MPQNNTNLLSYTYEGQKADTCPIGLKSICWIDCSPFGTSRRWWFPCFSQLLELPVFFGPWSSSSIFFFFLIWLHQVVVAACGIFNLHCSTWHLYFGMQTLSCIMWDLVPWSGIKPGPSCIGSTEPLDNHGSPLFLHLRNQQLQSFFKSVWF